MKIVLQIEPSNITAKKKTRWKEKPVPDNPLKTSSITLGGKVSFRNPLAYVVTVHSPKVELRFSGWFYWGSPWPPLCPYWSIRKKSGLKASRILLKVCWSVSAYPLLYQQHSKKIKGDPDNFSHHGGRCSYSLQLFTFIYSFLVLVGIEMHQCIGHRYLLADYWSIYNHCHIGYSIKTADGTTRWFNN